MSLQAQVTLRTRKLGVLIRDTRLAARKTLPECAGSIGVTPGILRAWEEGRRSPSLPELEILAFSLNLPISRFWGRDAASDDAPSTGSTGARESQYHPGSLIRIVWYSNRKAEGL